MKIEKIDLYHITQSLVSPFTTSFGTELDRHCLILALYADGLVGWGECVASVDPGYSYETTQTAWHILTQFLIPSVLGKELDEPEQVQEWMSQVRGHPMAKAAIDQAAWDITAQRDGLSFAQKLALPYPEGPREQVSVGVSNGIQPSVADTLKVIEGRLKEGYRRIKLKIKPGHDLELARAATAAFPDVAIMLDANSAYTLETAVPIFQAMDDLNLLMIEQPLAHDDILDHSLLHPQIKNPLCLDESIHSAHDTRLAITLNACDIINIKPARVGGFTNARKIHDLCREAGIAVWCGGMLETGVGRAAQLGLASLPGFTLPGDISATERYYKRDITQNFTLNTENSTIDVPTGLGLGIEIDFTQLEEVTLRKETFRNR
ncbi:MAG: o-succinylbenzoate synthase [Anaerolineales bacterium]|nr:o-succinylbenzoate synthase [Anaerolineales bacterium]